MRAYRLRPTFLREFHEAQNVHTSGWFAFIATSRWLAVRLDFLCAIFLTCVCMLSVRLAEDLDAGLVGLSISYSLSLLGGNITFSSAGSRSIIFRILVLKIHDKRKRGTEKP